LITALITFLGGTACRMFFGHLLDMATKWQDARNELAHIKLQGELDAAQHGRNLESIKLQADLGVKIIEAHTQQHVTSAEADAFLEAVQATGRQTGVKWVDLWNGIIRPMLATVAIALWVSTMARRGFVPDEWDRALMGSVLGIFVGGRIMSTGR
jgi:hypothetical protein